MTKGSGNTEKLVAAGYFNVICYKENGDIKWEGKHPNLVVNTGLQSMNTNHFKGSSYTASFFIGLVTGPAAGTTFAAGDTLASHSGWTESIAYSGNRPAVTFGTASTADPSVITNSSSPSSFTMNATLVVGGAFLCTVNTGTSGILFSASDFASPGDRSVVSGDVLNVTYTFSLDAS